MRHVPQGPDECQLATLAMLADRPLEQVCARALQIANTPNPGRYRTWVSVFRRPARQGRPFWPVIGELARELGLGPVAIGCREFCRSLAYGVQPGAGEPDLSGRGQITVAVSARKPAHAVAYEDGVVYDPEGPTPAPFAEWWARRQAEGWRTFAVHPAPPRPQFSRPSGDGWEPVSAA